MKKFNLVKREGGVSEIVNAFFGYSKKEAIAYFNVYHFTLFNEFIRLNKNGHAKIGKKTFYVEELRSVEIFKK